MYEILEQLLAAKGITAYRLSRETGVSQSTLSDWKRGRSTPKQDKLQRIADYFGVSISYLVNGTIAPPEKAVYEDGDLGELIVNLLSKLKSDAPLIFNGKPLDYKTRELLKVSLENSLRIAEITSKNKFHEVKKK